MDGRTFDALTRTAANGATRRGALGLLAGAALAAGLAKLDLAAAKKHGGGKGKGKGKNKKKRCKKSFQDCGGKKKCCKGLTCVDGSCGCPTGTIPSGGKCINPDPAECDNDNDCGNNQVCQNGECVPEPECIVDDECGDNEQCNAGECICPEIEDGRCIRRCENGSDAECPGAASCRNLSPSQSQTFDDGVCVNEAFFLCDTASCTTNSQCAADEVCVMLSCEGDLLVGRCQEIAVF